MEFQRHFDPLKELCNACPSMREREQLDFGLTFYLISLVHRNVSVDLCTQDYSGLALNAQSYRDKG